MKDDKGKAGGIGLVGALSIGVGGIVGGGFFAVPRGAMQGQYIGQDLF